MQEQYLYICSHLSSWTSYGTPPWGKLHRLNAISKQIPSSGQKKNEYVHVEKKIFAQMYGGIMASALKGTLTFHVIEGSVAAEMHL